MTTALTYCIKLEQVLDQERKANIKAPL